MRECRRTLAARAAGMKSADERGNAPVEFIGWATVIAVPLAYFLVALSAVQAATFGVESAVDSAARILSVDSSARSQEHARLAAELALVDQGVDQQLAEQAMTLHCQPSDCSGGTLVIQVQVPVNLPVIGQVGDSALVTVDASRAITGQGEE